MRLFRFLLTMTRPGAQPKQIDAGVLRRSAKTAKICSELNNPGWKATGKVTWKGRTK